MSILSDEQRNALLAKSHELQLRGVDYQRAAQDASDELLPRGVSANDFPGDEWVELGHFLEQSPDEYCECASCRGHDWRSDERGED